MEASFVFKKFDVEVVSSIFKKYPLTKGIFSTVIDKEFCVFGRNGISSDQGAI